MSRWAWIDTCQGGSPQRIAVNAATMRLIGCVLGLLLAANLILLGFFEISNGDTWWHLKEGELYVTTRSLPA